MYENIVASARHGKISWLASRNVNKYQPGDGAAYAGKAAASQLHYDDIDDIIDIARALPARAHFHAMLIRRPG